jgi:hypothetical protein
VDDGAKGGSGNMLYLPLDKLLERARTREPSDTAVDQTRSSPEVESVTVDGRARGER